ncbi:TPA: hypothetical protein ACIAIE_005230 [Serratia fonticola]
MAIDLLKAFKASELHDKNVNFLIGSGASASFIPTLKINDDFTYEDILTKAEFAEIENIIYYLYYNDILKKSFCHLPIEKNDRLKYKKTLVNYLRFIKNLVTLVNNKSANQIRRANIFTTNYDLFMERASDILLSRTANFIFNDGARGLSKRHLSISNFHTSTWHQGTNDLYKFEIPTINMIKMHGSVSWNKVDNDIIRVSYPEGYVSTLDANLENNNTIQEIVELVNTNAFIYSAKDSIRLSGNDDTILNNFRVEYNKLAIVNPTKAKFEETVFQQHYYQSLRLLSYELEKPQTVLICFGFSFKDEHIREIIYRSLSNPSLIVYVFCYKKSDKEAMKKIINNKKIIFISPSNNEKGNVIDIKRFINCIFPNGRENALENLTCNF